MKTKILIIGSKGQLGSALCKIFNESNDYEVYGGDQLGENNSKLDIKDKSRLEEIINKIQPNIIINTAAMVHADRCETEKELAFETNVEGNSNILECAKKFNSLYVFLSSYYVFDGENKEYTEEDILTPPNYYGIGKSLAERETLTYDKSIVIRACKIFSTGHDTRNLIARTDELLRKGETINVPCDQYNNAIDANYMAKTIKELIEKDKKGLFNVGGKDVVSSSELAKKYASLNGLDPKLVNPTTTNDLDQAAKRPRYVHLKVDKLEREGIETYSLNEMIKNGR